jgi:hypothetical protein
MPWLIGIDEAGYGPNLGPLVMTAVACRVPNQLVGADLWQALRPAVRRPNEADDGRLVIEDSKLVYSPVRGLAGLEIGVAATMAPCRSGQVLTLAEYIDWCSPACHPELRAEPWYAGTSTLPVLARPEDVQAAAERFAQACTREAVSWDVARSVVVCPARFNQILDRWNSKGVVLGLGLAELLRCLFSLGEDTEPLWFVIDKHGGRNTYAALLQNAIPEGMVVAVEEGRQRSEYQVLGLKREIRLSFRPRADATQFCVALASMCSKYLREVLMLEFNQYWQGHVPGIKPTAGYPGDSARFFDQIRPAAARLGIAEAALWRRR